MAQANPIHVNARRVVAAAFRAFLLSVDYPSLSPLLSVRFMVHISCYSDCADFSAISSSSAARNVCSAFGGLRSPLRIIETYVFVIPTFCARSLFVIRILNFRRHVLRRFSKSGTQSLVNPYPSFFQICRLKC